MAISHLKRCKHLSRSVQLCLYRHPPLGVGLWGNASMISQSNTNLKRASKIFPPLYFLLASFYAIFMYSPLSYNQLSSESLRDRNGHHDILQLKLFLQQFIFNIDVTLAGILRWPAVDWSQSRQHTMLCPRHEYLHCAQALACKFITMLTWKRYHGFLCCLKPPFENANILVKRKWLPCLFQTNQLLVLKQLLVNIGMCLPRRHKLWTTKQNKQHSSPIKGKIWITVP